MSQKNNSTEELLVGLGGNTPCLVVFKQRLVVMDSFTDRRYELDGPHDPIPLYGSTSIPKSSVLGFLQDWLFFNEITTCQNSKGTYAS